MYLKASPIADLTFNAGRRILKPWSLKNKICRITHPLGLEPMPQDVLEDNKEVLQRHGVRVELSAALERGLDELLHHQLADVDKVTALDAYRVTL